MCSLFLFKGIMGCLGGMLLHLIVGSIYQWGILNVYISSYYSVIEKPQTLSVNAVVFPVMMTCVGFTMKLGNVLALKVGTPFLTMGATVLMALLVFLSSYVKVFAGFVILYGVLFGLLGGLVFTSVMVENNKYFKNKQMYVNGIILIGTGLGPAIFGLFSYAYLNPGKLQPVDGMYVIPQLVEVALRVPSLLRYLALFELCVGLLGSLLILPVYFHNNRTQVDNLPQPDSSVIAFNFQGDVNAFDNLQRTVGNQHNSVPVTLRKDLKPPELATQPRSQVPSQDEITDNLPKEATILSDCPSLATAFSSRITYFFGIDLYLGIMGGLFVNNNFKTYAKKDIADDQYLTTIGALAAVTNGLVRLPWNLIFTKLQLKHIYTFFTVKNILLYCTLDLTLQNPQLYCFMIIMCNVSLGGFLGLTPTQCLRTFGMRTGSDIYGFYWIIFGCANFTSYGLGVVVDPYILFFVFAGTSTVNLLIIWLIDLKVDWNKSVPPPSIEMQSMPFAVPVPVDGGN